MFGRHIINLNIFSLLAFSCTKKLPELGGSSNLASIQYQSLEKDSRYNDYTHIRVKLFDYSTGIKGQLIHDTQKVARQDAKEAEIKVKAQAYYFQVQFFKNSSILLSSEACKTQEYIAERTPGPLEANKKNNVSVHVCPVTAESSTPEQPAVPSTPTPEQPVVPTVPEQPAVPSTPTPEQPVVPTVPDQPSQEKINVNLKITIQ